MSLNTKRVRICKNCGLEFAAAHGTMRLCSDECRKQREDKLRIARARSKGVLPWEDRKALEKAAGRKTNCAVCGIEFRPRQTGSRRLAVTCSTNCRGISQRKYATIEERRAAILAVKRAAKNTPQKIAAREAKAADRAAKQAELDKLRSTCIHCSGPVEPELRGEYRFRPACQTCKVARAEESRKKWKRAGKAKRRAAARGSDAERFDPFEIFDRDGWRCHLCGVKTVKAKRGTHHPLAPELDHIIPISKGGPHTRANTACSCRRCNHAKGCEIIGQPSLFATIAV
jgi:5-methylcytosine-specific restriction endonuclease McrA